jgi:hypothetical protein
LPLHLLKYRLDKVMDDRTSFNYSTRIPVAPGRRGTEYRGGGEAALLPFEAHSDVRLFLSALAGPISFFPFVWCIAI